MTGKIGTKYKGNSMVDVKICKRCGKPIGKARLDAMPGTDICAKCLRPDMIEEDHDLVENVFNNDNISLDEKKNNLAKKCGSKQKIRKYRSRDST